jgi:uncharacterized membrane protein
VSGEDRPEVEGVAVSSRLFSLVVLGISLVFVGIAVLIVASVFAGGGSGSVGGVIFIGPFPIVFGVGPDATWLIAFSVVLAIISIVLFLVMNRRVKRIVESKLVYSSVVSSSFP